MFGLQQPRSEPMTAIYGLTSKARCIAAQGCLPDDAADDDDDEFSSSSSRSRFLVGTLALRDENEVHLVEVDESDPDAPALQEVAVYAHPGEVWALGPAPHAPGLLVTSYAGGSGAPHCTLWRLPRAAADAPSGSLAPVAHAASSDGRVCAVEWAPRDAQRLLLLDLHSVRLATVGDGLRETAVVTRPDMRFAAVRWSPLQEHVVATAGADGAVRAWDLRSGSSGGNAAFSVDRAHADHVRDIDFNPNSLHHFATGGDDCKVRVWDVRRLARPVRTLSAHSHWVWSVRYNPFHDELLLSSGSDGRVVLWDVTSLSSKVVQEPSSASKSTSKPSRRSDGPIRVYEEHEDSVYGVAWGSSPSSSLWSFVSLSYAGRVVLNYVPREFSDLLNS